MNQRLSAFAACGLAVALLAGCGSDNSSSTTQPANAVGNQQANGAPPGAPGGGGPGGAFFNNPDFAKSLAKELGVSTDKVTKAFAAVQKSGAGFPRGGRRGGPSGPSGPRGGRFRGGPSGPSGPRGGRFPRRGATGPGGPGGGGFATFLAAPLAKQLGLPESKVSAALAKVMQSFRPQGGPPPGGAVPPAGGSS